MRKPHMAVTATTFILLSIAGGFSFMLPNDLSLPEATASIAAGPNVELLAIVAPAGRSSPTTETVPITLRRDDSGNLACRIENFQPLGGRFGHHDFTCLIDAEFTKAQGEGRAFLEFVGGGGARTEIFIDARQVAGDGSSQADLMTLGLPDDERHIVRFVYHGRRGGGLLRIRTNLELTRARSVPDR